MSALEIQLVGETIDEQWSGLLDLITYACECKQAQGGYWPAMVKTDAGKISVIFNKPEHPNQPATVEEILLPCPCCGAEAELDRMRGFRAMHDGHIGNAVAIYCLKCGLEISMCHEDFPHYDVEGLVKSVIGMWNVRMYPEASTRATESLTAQLQESAAAIEQWREAFELMQHKVITCGIIAEGNEHLNPIYQRDGKWDSKQAEQVRLLRAELKAERERVKNWRQALIWIAGHGCEGDHKEVTCDASSLIPSDYCFPCKAASRLHELDKRHLTTQPNDNTKGMEK